MYHLIGFCWSLSPGILTNKGQNRGGVKSALLMCCYGYPSPQYEYKSKGIKKIRSQLEISTAGVKVTKRRRMVCSLVPNNSTQSVHSHFLHSFLDQRRRAYTEAELLIMQHPIYRSAGPEISQSLHHCYPRGLQNLLCLT